MKKRDNWFKRKLVDPLLFLVKQGVDARKLALAISLGFVLSFFPVFGVHSLLCFLVIWLFRLNPGAVFLVNNLSYPLIFVMYLPQIRIGEWLFNAKPFSFSVDQVIGLISDSPLNAIKILWDSTMYALVAWLVIGTILFPFLFLILNRTFKRFYKKSEIQIAKNQ